MKSFFFKLLLLITLLVMGSSSIIAQYDWQKYASNPLNIHGSSGSWDQSVVTPCVIFNSDLNRYEMWYTSYTGSLPNNGIGFAWSTDGITWTKHPTAVLTPSPSSWDYPFVGAACVLKDGGTYKMWYTGGQSGNLSSSHIGYATSPDGILWTKYSLNPILSPLTGWESGAVGYPSVIKISGTYYMFYSGAVTVGIARTGRAISTDGITWTRFAGNPVLPAGGVGEWDRNNYLGKVIELDNTLYIYYTAESNPGVSGSAIGGAVSTDLGISWTKFENNPILTQGTGGQWDNGWIEGPCPVFAHNELKLYYDGGGAATGWLGRIGLATSSPLPAGTYTIGTGGDFATIQEAFNKLETDGVAGNVTLELIDELYTAPTGQYGFSLNGLIPGAGPNSRVTIKPAENRNVIIEGSCDIVLNFINVNYIILDGVDLSGSTTLQIYNLGNAQYQFNDAVSFLDNSDHNTVKNCSLISDGYLKGSSGVSFIYLNEAPDSNLIENNFVKKAGAGIYVAGKDQSIRAVGNIIRNNRVGSEVDGLISWGIQDQNTQNSIIENNVVQNINRQWNIGLYTPGINTAYSSGTIIRNNVVHNVNSGDVWGSVGILVSGESWAKGSNNSVYNNMVYDINCASTNSQCRLAGIQLFNQDNPVVYYNSVYLKGTGSGGNPLGSAALYISTGVTNAGIKNNIFVNTRDDSPYCASAIYDYFSSNINSDYNDLYYDDTNNNNCLVRIGSTNYLTLADWQAIGKDLNSVTEMPNFIAPDLHIAGNIFTLLDSSATPIAEVLTDIDGQPRSVTVPDIGADEFDIVSGVEEEITLPTEYILEQNYPNPFNPSTTFRYSLPQTSKVVIKVYDILGNEVAILMDEEKSVGTYELTWNAADLSSGIYFYQLNAGEFVNTKKMILLK